MRSFIRTAAAAWAVGLALLLVSYQPVAQEAEGEPAPLLTREYDISGLEQRELLQTPRTGAIGDVLAPDRLFFNGGDHALDQWSLRDSGEEARCWDNGYEVGESLQYILGYAGLEIENQGGNGTLSMRGNESSHETIAWMLSGVQEVADARVTMIVYRLPEARSPESAVVPANQVAGWAKGARFVGNFRGGLAEPFVLQKTGHESYVADYDLNMATEAVVAEPQVNILNTGEEFVLGAVSLSDGRLWVQGWHASMKLEAMRTINSNAGMIELPDVAYSYTPVSAVIENAGGAIIDAGDAGRFLVRAECNRVITSRERKLDNGYTIRLLNCIGLMRGQGLGGFWLMNPTSSALMEDSMFPQVMLEEIVDGPYFDSACEVIENSSSEQVALMCFGPFLAAVIPATDDWPEEDLARLAAETRMLDELPVTLPTAGVRIRVFQVADDADLPGGILAGRPSAADVAELETLAGKPQFDRVSTAALETQLDQFEVRMSTHLREYHSSSATGITALDPNVGTMVTGEQVRWQARDAGDGRLQIEVRSGITVGSASFEQVSVGNEGLVVERSRSALTQGRMADELAVGERMAAINPGAGADGTLVVIVVERLQ